jgi:hypothetical protein
MFLFLYNNAKYIPNNYHNCFQCLYNNFFVMNFCRNFAASNLLLTISF